MRNIIIFIKSFFKIEGVGEGGETTINDTSGTQKFLFKKLFAEYGLEVKGGLLDFSR